MDTNVPSQFPREIPCPFAFVGEAPSYEEIDKLTPFVGPSGKVFGALLRAAGIDRRDCYVGNVFSTQLEDNSVPRERERQGDNWDAFVESNYARLLQELEQSQPRLVVPLGGTALLALTGTSQIMSFRGHAMMGRGRFSKFKLFPTVHPAFVQRDWKWFVPVVGDLLKAQEEARESNIVLPPRRLHINPRIAEVERFLGGPCSQCSLLSVDIETTCGMIRGIAFAPSVSEAMYVPFVSLREPSRNYWGTLGEEKRAWIAVRDCLASPVPKLGQNFGQYDLHWLWRAGVPPLAYSEDLRLVHKTLYPELPASLEFMSGTYSKQGSWKSWTRYGGKKKDQGSKKHG